MPNIIPAPLTPATATKAGTISGTGTQIIGSDLGAGSTDVGIKVGSTVADASTHALAALLRVSTGLGGTEVPVFSFLKGGILVGTSGALRLNSIEGSQIDYGSSKAQMTSTLASVQGATFAQIYGLSGSGSTDVAVKAGSTVVDASVNAGAKLFSVRSGIGGTEVESLAVLKGNVLTGIGGSLTLGPTSAGATLAGGNNGCYVSPTTYTLYLNGGNGGGNVVVNNVTSFDLSSGIFRVNGTDSSGTPGAATINKARGISAIAAGASSVVITNSLATATSHIMITPLARDTTCKELAVTTRAAGSFTVSGTANATAALAFAWEVGGLL